MDADGRYARSIALTAIVAGLALTWFYTVHEALPVWIRAPSSLLLAPIALVDGLCYYLGLPGIYGRLLPVTAVNVLVVLLSAKMMRRLWAKRRGMTR